MDYSLCWAKPFGFFARLFYFPVRSRFRIPVRLLLFLLPFFSRYLFAWVAIPRIFNESNYNCQFPIEKFVWNITVWAGLCQIDSPLLLQHRKLIRSFSIFFRFISYLRFVSPCGMSNQLWNPKLAVSHHNLPHFLSLITRTIGK